MELKSLFFPLFALWIPGLILILFRRNLEFFWKLAALLIFLFYGIWFQDNIQVSFHLYAESFTKIFPILFQELGDILALVLFLVWPPLLLAAFFTKSLETTRGLLRTLVLFTLFYWVFWFLNFFTPPFLEDALTYLGNFLGELLGGAAESLSQPPIE